ncbi:hypothetical protein [Hymenobacter cellulosivorans]|uniref:GWxTD domain-containing protein n=1 Tax=Hymenobacter cellulosivorans TaxID=2932249 RepID=A0ABY4F628_9BACT|nr:hypothetical protein [Hymenobacter cellulosivorans]UOQ51567.1 hypothetical protein MUN80_17595 [Hymenobacter cellulosivorans]
MSFSPNVCSPTLLGSALLSVLLLDSCSAPAAPAGPPPTIGPDSTVQVAAGTQYMRGPVHRFFWGKHYRKLWATPVEAPVFNLRTAVPGGLTPVQEGGSFQTKNLRLVDKNGVQYVLRSVDKDATKALPEGLRDGPIGKLMKDQTSVINPYGAYIVAPLAAAAGVYHTNPRLVYVADDPALGEFRQSFANALYLFEERPEGDQRTVGSFGRSAKVESSRKVFTNLVTNNQHRIDARWYLRARLFDMWLGDWSRREDQWRWASFPGAGGATVYRPIPRDRDHAFFKFDDGVFTHIIGWVKSNYQSFHQKIRLADVEGLNRAARPMDKSLLVYLTAQDFQQVADSLQRNLSDQVIHNALALWPKAVYAEAGGEFTENLRGRRQQLPAVAARFYELLAQDVEIPGTDAPERFVLEPTGPGLLRVSHYSLHTGRPDSLVGQRTFNYRQTRSIKVFGLGGNDVFELRGLPDHRFAIGIYDGAGQDLVELKTTTDVAKAHTSVTVYDSGDGNTIRAAKPVKVETYVPAATEFDAAGWLLRHRLF